MNCLEVSNVEGLDDCFSNILPTFMNPTMPFSFSNPLIMGSAELQKQRDILTRDSFQAKLAQDKAKAEAEVKSQQTQTPTTSAPTTSATPSSPTISMPTSVTPLPNGGKLANPDKFLGMPKAVGITVAVVGGLALIGGAILLIRKYRK